MSEWSLRLQTPTSQLTAQLPHGATIKVLREHVAALTGLDAGGGNAGGDGRSADDRPPRPVREAIFL